MSRARWRRGRWWAVARFGGAGAVAAGSAIISYSHLRDVLLTWGYSPIAAGVGPLTLDGLMVVSGFALLSMTLDNETSTDTTTSVTPDAERRAPQQPETGEDSAVPPWLAADVLTGHPVTSPASVSGHGQTTTDIAPVPADSTTTDVADIAAPEVNSAASAVSAEDSGADNRRAMARTLHGQGWTHARIAAELGVSKRTIRRYLSTTVDTENIDTAAVSEPASGIDEFGLTDITEPAHAITTLPMPAASNHKPLEGVFA
ncbi:DUF2637 domain-containing protein [Nocardia sp. NPDC050710]|uniref:DUF2637 domain-containing protein n=1 Tax=Nocardia sp. NPDC050710 TaxID=3157220 RepID=UPI0033C2EC86